MASRLVFLPILILGPRFNSGGLEVNDELYCYHYSIFLFHFLVIKTTVAYRLDSDSLNPDQYHWLNEIIRYPVPLVSLPF